MNYFKFFDVFLENFNFFEVSFKCDTVNFVNV